VGPLGSRHAWLSITPEPERELPEAIATLRCGGPPPRELVERERALVERLVTRGSRMSWRAYLTSAAALARESGADERLADARAVVDEVLENHDNLTLGLTRRRRRGRLSAHFGGTP
jgi:hypothetical protein